MIESQIERVDGNFSRNLSSTADQSRCALYLIRGYCTVQTKKKIIFTSVTLIPRMQDHKNI